MTAQDLETFTKLVETAQSQFLKDEANRRLRSAQDFDDVSTAVEKSPVEEKQVEENVVSDGVVTTEEELQAYCQMRVFGTGVLGTRYCRVPGSWYRAEGCVGPARLY